MAAPTAAAPASSLFSLVEISQVEGVLPGRCILELLRPIEVLGNLRPVRRTTKQSINEATLEALVRSTGWKRLRLSLPWAQVRRPGRWPPRTDGGLYGAPWMSPEVLWLQLEATPVHQFLRGKGETDNQHETGNKHEHKKKKIDTQT